MDKITNQNQQTPDEKSCGVVLFRKKEPNDPTREYLILHYPSGHFDLAKGHVEDFDESEYETAARELEEETGITNIEFSPDFREEIHYRYRKKGQPSLKQVVFFLAETEEKEVTISHEHQGFVWLEFAAAKEKLTFDNAKNLVVKAEQHLSNNS